MVAIKVMFELAHAMNAARVRANDQTLAQEVKAGRFRLVRATYDSRGVSTVVPLTAWSDVTAHLRAIATWPKHEVTAAKELGFKFPITFTVRRR